MTAGSDLPYFAYGANVHPGWLRRRVPSADVLGPATLPRHRIAFHKRGRDGAGKSNAWYTGDANDLLPGVLYRLPAHAFQRLGAAGAGYVAAEVTVRTPSGPVTALTWRADPAEIQEGLRPWDWYVALICAGAALHGLPEAHRRWLASVAFDVDPDAERAAAAFSVIDAAAHTSG